MIHNLKLIASASLAGLLSACMASTTPVDRISDASQINEPARYALHEFGADGDQPVLLFHMAASNVRGEYAEIAPRLVAAGYHVFGADLPLGGERFGFDNTVSVATDEPDYCSDYPAVVAAIEEVVDQTGKRPILVGSSYTAALTMKAAVEHPDIVSGFVSVSPAPAGGLEVCAPGELLADLAVPGLGMRPRNEAEYEIIIEQARAWAGHGVQTKIVEVRSHGVSLLDPKRSGENAEAAWPAFLWFLEQASEVSQRGG